MSARDAWASALAESKIAGAVLVAGTSKGGKRLFEPGADADLSTVINANLETARISLQALLPGMVAAKSGSVARIGSRTAARPWRGTHARRLMPA